MDQTEERVEVFVFKFEQVGMLQLFSTRLLLLRGTPNFCTTPRHYLVAVELSWSIVEGNHHTAGPVEPRGTWRALKKTRHHHENLNQHHQNKQSGLAPRGSSGWIAIVRREIKVVTVPIHYDVPPKKAVSCKKTVAKDLMAGYSRDPRTHVCLLQ